MSKSDKHKTKLDSEKKSINKKSYTNINNSENKLLEIFKILPLILIVGILPFVIRLKLIPLQGPFYEFWNGEKINADFFTYYKQIFIYIVTVWALLHTFLFTKKIKFTKAYYFMGAYAVLVILSTIFSKYPQIALHGFVERREGMWVILCYLLLMFSTINLVETEKQIKAIIYTLGISGAVISIISIFQYFGMDIFTTEFAKNFMISKEIQAQIKEFNIQFGEKYSYGVFYNPNYLGGYISFYAPLMLSFVIISKDIRERAAFAVFFILSIFALYGSRSEAGVLGTVGAIGLLILILTARYIIKDKPKEEHKKLLLTRFVPILLALAILPVSMSYIHISENPLARIRTEAVALFQPSDLKGKTYKEIGPINDIIINNNKIVLLINNKRLELSTDGKNFVIDDFNKVNTFQIQERVEDFLFLDSNEERIKLNVYPGIKNSDTCGIELFWDDFSRLKLFFKVADGKIAITNPNFEDIVITESAYIGFYGKGWIASSRGYIWSRTLPIIINDSIVIGKGQDTFIAMFPQYDLYAKQVEYGSRYTSMWSLVDKPHSSYVQIGIQSGLISLLIIFASLLLLLSKNMKKILYFEYNNLIIIGVIGFLLASIFNDSILGITPMAYILIGLTFAEEIE